MTSANEPAEPAEPAKSAESAESTPAGSTDRRLPRAVWGAAAAGIVAIIGAVLPWFAPTGEGVSIPKAYCLQAGRIGFLAPLAIVVAAVMVVAPRLRRGAENPPIRRLDTDGFVLLGCAVAAGIVLGLVWIFLPDSYSFNGTTWDRLNAEGRDLSRGPEVGYYVTIAAAALGLIGGLALVRAGRREPQ